MALWKYRAALDSEERLVNEASKLTSTVTELNEKNHLDELHVHYVDESGTFPARNIRGFELRGQVMMYERSYDNLNWCLVNSPHRDLIVPDTPEDDLFIPITPSMCLLTGQPVH